MNDSKPQIHEGDRIEGNHVACMWPVILKDHDRRDELGVQNIRPLLIKLAVWYISSLFRVNDYNRSSLLLHNRSLQPAIRSQNMARSITDLCNDYELFHHFLCTHRQPLSLSLFFLKNWRPWGPKGSEVEIRRRIIRQRAYSKCICGAYKCEKVYDADALT